MPRTPAPLTVAREPDGWQWSVRDPSGLLIGSFYREADARAFVALPALLITLKALSEQMELEAGFVQKWADTAKEGLANHPAADLNSCAAGILAYKQKIDAALAAADGPSQEQG